METLGVFFRLTVALTPSFPSSRLVGGDEMGTWCKGLIDGKPSDAINNVG